MGGSCGFGTGSRRVGDPLKWKRMGFHGRRTSPLPLSSEE